MKKYGSMGVNVLNPVHFDTINDAKKRVIEELKERHPNYLNLSFDQSDISDVQYTDGKSDPIGVLKFTFDIE